MAMPRENQRENQPFYPEEIDLTRLTLDELIELKKASVNRKKYSKGLRPDSQGSNWAELLDLIAIHIHQEKSLIRMIDVASQRLSLVVAMIGFSIAGALTLFKGVYSVLSVAFLILGGLFGFGFLFAMVKDGQAIRKN